MIGSMDVDENPSETSRDGQTKSSENVVKCGLRNISPLIRFLSTVGFDCSTDVPFLLKVDPADARSRVSKLLHYKPNKLEIAAAVAKDFKALLQKDGSVELLLTCLPVDPSVHSTDSLCHIIMAEECLAPLIADILVSYVVNLAQLRTRKDFSQTLRKVLDQLKWREGMSHDNTDITRKLLDILSVVPDDLKKEIIAVIPVVAQGSALDLVVQRFKDLLNKSEMIAPVFDALTSIVKLPDRVLADIREHAVSLLNTAELPDLPVVVDFLLETAQDKDMRDTIQKIRQALDFAKVAFDPIISSTPMIGKAGPSAGSFSSLDFNAVALILNAFANAMQRRAVVGDEWFQLLVGFRKDQWLILDFFVVLLLMSHTPKRQDVIKMFLTQMGNGVVLDSYFDEALSSFGPAFDPYQSEIFLLASKCFAATNVEVCEIGSALFKASFENMSSAKCSAAVLKNLVKLLGDYRPHISENALRTLSDIVLVNPKRVEKFSKILKLCLDLQHHLSLSQLRVVYNMLCHVARACPGSGMAEELGILVNKQVNTETISPKDRCVGIIGALAMVKTWAISTELIEAGDDDDDQTPRIIALLTNTLDCCKRYPDLIALFCDELTEVFPVLSTNKTVHKWMITNISNSMRENFLRDYHETGYGPSATQQVMMRKSAPCVRFLVTDEVTALDHNPPTFLLNLYPMVVAEKNIVLSGEGFKSPRVLSSLLRFDGKISLCGKQCQKDDFSGMLFAPILMYDESLEDLAKFRTLSYDEKELILNSLFYACNWLRELVNIFSDNKQFHATIQLRLVHILSIQSTISKLIKEISGYRPPPALFYNPSSSKMETSPKRKGRTAKKKSQQKSSPMEIDDAEPQVAEVDVDEEDREEGDEEDDLGSVTSKTTTGSKSKKSKSGARGVSKHESSGGSTDILLPDYIPNLRELELNVFSLLSSVMVSTENLDAAKISDSTMIKSGQSLLFLFDDLARKINHRFPVKESPLPFGKKAPVAAPSLENFRLDRVSRDDFVKWICKIVPDMVRHVESLQEIIKVMCAEKSDISLEIVGGTGNPYTTVVVTFNIVLKCLVRIVEFSKSQRDQQPLLLATFRVLSGESIAHAKKIGPVLTMTNNFMPVGQASLAKLAEKVFDKIYVLAEAAPSIACALLNLKLVELVTEMVNAENQMKFKFEIGKLCGEYLHKDWFDWQLGVKEIGPKHTEAVGKFLKKALQMHPKPLELIKELTDGPIAASVDGSIEANVQDYPSFTKATLPMIFRSILLELGQAARNNLREYNDGMGVEKTKEELLGQWKVACAVLFSLFSMVKHAKMKKPLMSAAMRGGRIFVEAFLAKAMPLLDSSFKRHQDQVLEVLDCLQRNTRFLQTLCSHGKRERDVQLSLLVAPLKRVVELLIYRVEGMLTAYGCQEAIKVGNLKHKNLEGDVVPSQMPSKVGKEKFAKSKQLKNGKAKGKSVVEDESDSEDGSKHSSAENGDEDAEAENLSLDEDEIPEVKDHQADNSDEENANSDAGQNEVEDSSENESDEESVKQLKTKKRTGKASKSNNDSAPKRISKRRQGSDSEEDEEEEDQAVAKSSVSFKKKRATDKAALASEKSQKKKVSQEKPSKSQAPVGKINKRKNETDAPEVCVSQISSRGNVRSLGLAGAKRRNNFNVPRMQSKESVASNATAKSKAAATVNNRTKTRLDNLESQPPVPSTSRTKSKKHAS